MRPRIITSGAATLRTVTLTVTDNKGSISSVRRQVEVAIAAINAGRQTAR